MQFYSAQDLARKLDWSGTIAALANLFAEGCEVPVRHHHEIAVPGQADATLLIMPAWRSGHYTGIKLVNIYPDNPSANLPAIRGNYLLMDGSNGATLALFDAGELTVRRTAAASALASRLLSRPDSSKLLVVGSGRLASTLAFAHRAARPITDVQVWARSSEKAAKLVDRYRQAGLSASIAESLPEACAWADIISCATASEEPLVLGDTIEPGTHVDLVGAYKPHMRESDDALVAAAQVFVDTREGVMAEAGDLLIPMKNGLFSARDIRADLAELVCGDHPGRQSAAEVTLFKSVGTALEDLAAAVYCYESD
jgi:ornithine cyclodeaminase/alanine dehydrogenase-like protein (mu-crystallin family)